MSEPLNQYLSDLVAASEFADYLDAHHAEIMAVLTEQESHETALDELERSVLALRGLHREMHNLREAHVGDVSAFLPINLPLYSLVLFAAVPSLMADRVFVRTPAVDPEWVRRVFDVSGMKQFFPRVGLFDLQRREFLDHFVSRSEVVLFTGRYSNAVQVQRCCRGAKFVFNGAGVNPVVVGPGADVGEALGRIITTRVFNSGQDCAGPDAFLVHSSVADEFVESAREELLGIGVGDYSDPSVRVGRILNPGPIPGLVTRLEELKANTVLEGAIHIEDQIVEPTMIVRPITEHDRIVEFFAPGCSTCSPTTTTSSHGSSTARNTAVRDVRRCSELHCCRRSRRSNPLVELTVLDVEHGQRAVRRLWDPRPTSSPPGTDRGAGARVVGHRSTHRPSWPREGHAPVELRVLVAQDRPRRYS